MPQCHARLRTPLTFAIALVAALAGALFAPEALAQSFEEGSHAATLVIGAGRQLERNYTVLGGRFGTYFVRDFEASVAAEVWRGNDPSIVKITPELRYVYSRRLSIKPYLGIFVSRSFISHLPDTNTYGMKGGAYFTLSPGAYFGIGAVYERIESCNRSDYGDCSNTYPEVSLHFLYY